MRFTGSTFWNAIFTILGGVLVWYIVTWLATIFAVPGEIIKIIGILIFLAVIYNLYIIFIEWKNRV